MKKLVMLWILQLMMIATMKVVSAEPTPYGYGPANASAMDQAMQIYDRLGTLLQQASCESIGLVVPNRRPDPNATGQDAAVIQVLVNRLEALEPQLIRTVGEPLARQLMEAARARLNALVLSRCANEGVLQLYHGVEK